MWLSRHAVPRAWKRSLRACVSKAEDGFPFLFDFPVSVSGAWLLLLLLFHSNSRSLVVISILVSHLSRGYYIRGCAQEGGGIPISPSHLATIPASLELSSLAL